MVYAPSTRTEPKPACTVKLRALHVCVGFGGRHVPQGMACIFEEVPNDLLGCDRQCAAATAKGIAHRLDPDRRGYIIPNLPAAQGLGRERPVGDLDDVGVRAQGDFPQVHLRPEQGPQNDGISRGVQENGRSVLGRFRVPEHRDDVAGIALGLGFEIPLENDALRDVSASLHSFREDRPKPIQLAGVLVPLACCLDPRGDHLVLSVGEVTGHHVAGRVVNAGKLPKVFRS